MSVKFPVTVGTANYVQFSTDTWKTPPMAFSFWIQAAHDISTMRTPNWSLPWVILGDYSQWYRIVAHGFWDAANLCNRLGFEAVNLAGAVTEIYQDFTIQQFTTGYWHHAVFQISNTFQMDLYFDGKLHATSNALGSLNQNSLPLGMRHGTDQNELYQWDGLLDDFRYYNRVLTANEIATIYACQGADSIFYGAVNRWLYNEHAANTSVGGFGQVHDFFRNQDNGYTSGSPQYQISQLHIRRKANFFY